MNNGDDLDLDRSDREIRINELTERLNCRSEGMMHISDECTPEMHEEFLGHIEQFETAPIGTHFAQLVDAGVELPHPDSLTDEALHFKLWQVINALLEMDAYLYHTDHLSDRQLYEHLWSDTLREEKAMLPPGSGWRNHIDLIGSGSDEDIQIGLRYYDSEDSRRHWAQEFPGDVIPPHEDPPYNRDRNLPKADPEF